MKRKPLLVVLGLAAAAAVVLVVVLVVNGMRAEAARAECAARYPVGSMDYYACLEFAG